MSENRIEQIYDMVTQLIKIVGNTTVAIEELREGQQRLEKNQENTNVAIEELRQGQQRLEKNQENTNVAIEKLREGQQRLEKNQEKFKPEILDKLDTLDNEVDYLAHKFLEHDMKIFGQKHKKVVRD